jgi:hypothetical protein
MGLDIICKIKPFFLHLKGLCVFVCYFLISCNTATHPRAADLEEVSLEYVSFENLFFGELDTPLEDIKAQFPFFFPDKTLDSLWLEKRIDSLQQQLFNATKAISKSSLQSRVVRVFQYANYYFPEEKLPQTVISLLTDVDYSLRAVDAETMLLLSIDTYLGVDHPLYEGIPTYIKNNLTLKHLESEIIDALAPRFIPAPSGRTFLDQMVHNGKRLLLHDYLAPKLEPHQHIQYTETQWEWAITHQAEVWRYFIDNKLLFSTDENLPFRFLLSSPYSKFYSYLDVDSPGRIGQWIGYQMLKKYQKRSGESLQEILDASPQEILKKSKYNP